MTADAATYEVSWRGRVVGTIKLAAGDMAYMEGEWEAGPDAHARAFATLANGLVPRRVLAAPATGTAVELVQGEDTRIDALVLGLRGRKLALRMVSAADAREWLRKNVR